MTALVTGLVMGPKIGAGHYGEVFLATDPVHVEVAAKVLARLPGEPDEKWHPRRDGLLQEAQRMAAATHRNVVQVHGSGVAPDGESICFTMALCPGGSLQDAFERGPSLLATVRKVATEVTFGLQALHQRGMLHRDIKPANILLDGEGVALLGDFGWVTDEIFLGYAKAGGYLDHLAYEAWGTGAASVKSDIWALGMTLYRLIHGRNWYARQDTPRFVIRNGGFVDSLEWLPHVPARWRRVIRQMLSDDTAVRQQNCEQLLAAFAGLAVDADWACMVDDDLIAWSRTQGDRIHRVEWTCISARRHEWRAWTEPRQAGRSRKMGGSGGVTGRAACVAGLRAYFDRC